MIPNWHAYIFQVAEAPGHGFAKAVILFAPRNFLQQNGCTSVDFRSCIEKFLGEIDLNPIGSMYGIYANLWGILMVNVTIYSSTMDPMGFRSALHVVSRITSSPPQAFEYIKAQENTTGL